MSISDEVTFDPRHYLYEHCGECVQGLVQRNGCVEHCGKCVGGRRRRGTHDLRSSIDFDSPTESGGAFRREPAGIDPVKLSDARATAPGGPPSVDPRAVSLNEPQPPPHVGHGVHSVDLVVGDLWERKAHGIEKYGVAHQWDNRRDHLVDIYQEQLDAAIYTRAEIEKRRRMVELARLLRDPTNSAPLTELLDLVEAGT